MEILRRAGLLKREPTELPKEPALHQAQDIIANPNFRMQDTHRAIDIIMQELGKQPRSWYDKPSHSVCSKDPSEFVSFHRNYDGRGFQGSRITFGSPEFRQAILVGTGSRVPMGEVATRETSVIAPNNPEGTPILRGIGLNPSLNSGETIQEPIDLAKVQVLMQVALSFIKEVSSQGDRARN